MTPKYKALRNWRINADDLINQRHSDFLQQSLPEDLGHGQTNFYHLDPVLDFIETHYRPSRNFNLISQVGGGEPKIIVTLGLKGHSSYKGKEGVQIPFKEGYTTVTSFSAGSGERIYRADQEISQLRIALSKTSVERYFGGQNVDSLFNKKAVQTLGHRLISALSRSVLSQLKQSRLQNQCSRLLLHAQALAILASELDILFSDEEPIVPGAEKDEELAWMARDILTR